MAFFLMAAKSFSSVFSLYRLRRSYLALEGQFASGGWQNPEVIRFEDAVSEQKSRVRSLQERGASALEASAGHRTHT